LRALTLLAIASILALWATLDASAGAIAVPPRSRRHASSQPARRSTGGDMPLDVVDQHSQRGAGRRSHLAPHLLPTSGGAPWASRANGSGLPAQLPASGRLFPPPSPPGHVGWGARDYTYQRGRGLSVSRSLYCGRLVRSVIRLVQLDLDLEFLQRPRKNWPAALRKAVLSYHQIQHRQWLTSGFGPIP